MTGDVRVGLVAGLLLSAAVLLVRARYIEPRAAPHETLAVMSEAQGALDEVLMHYVPELGDVLAPTYRDFLRSLDPKTRVTFVIRRGDQARLDAFLEGDIARERVRVVEIDVPLGAWSKDRALVLSTVHDGRAALLIPPRPRPGEGSRPADWDIVPALALAMPDEIVAREIPFAFDAGDLAITNGRIVVDVNLFARNRSRGIKTPGDLRERVEAVFGHDVIMLGSDVGDVPRHHMSMYMALLDDDTALVGDPRAGLAMVGSDYTPGETSPETDLPLHADFSAETLARFDRAAADLAAAGFRVVRIPTVAFDDKTYFAYTNGVYETRAGRRIARTPWFDVKPLDDAARKVYESLGWSVIPIAARSIYPQHGAIGCLVNVLRRS
jgi:hypothetical protein